MASHALRSLLLIALLGACDCDDEDPGGVPTVASSASTTLLETEGVLVARGDGTLGVDHDVAVQAGQHITVHLRSSEFDPLLQVTPPGTGTLTNDDFDGSREESRLSFVVAEAGTMKVLVASAQPSASGAYELEVLGTGGPAAPGIATAPAAVLQAGASIDGEVGPGDPRLADGRYQETLMLTGGDAGALELHVVARSGVVPLAILMSPGGQALSPSANGRYTIAQPGVHRLQLLTPDGNAPAPYHLTLDTASGALLAPTLARDHHQLPTAPASATATIGQALEGSLDPTDGTLPTGERADIYGLTGEAGTSVRLELSSIAFDAYLMVVGPTGRHWENDDAGGTTDSVLELQLPTSGTYRVVASSFRAGAQGAYELKISGGGRTAGPTVAGGPTPATPSSPGRSIRGELADGDQNLQSGELFDEHRLHFEAGEQVHLEARSTQFDTYLIVHPPSGEQQDNDDGDQGTDAVLDFLATTAGDYRVVVTSYEPGERGAYELVVGGAGGSSAGGTGGTGGGTPTTAPPTGGSPAVGDRVAGALQASDGTLSSGEHVDVYTRTFTPGAPVQIRLSSSQIDPYLIVRSPSGHQMDNDDLDASTRDAGVDLPAAEAGTYHISVTSYRPGETGSYALSFGEGQPVPGAEGSGGHVYGLFVGISDYPDGVGDLPECANDAIKLAEALRTHGLLDAQRQVVLTDAQATRANLRSALQRLAGQMGPDDTFVFFYSGHGGQEQRGASSDPREIDATDEFLVLHDGQLLDDELGRLFQPVRAGIAVAAIDACNSGGFAKDLITRPGRVGLFSSEEDVLSAVASQFQAGGYLSHFMRTAVSGDADSAPRDQVLTVGELTHFLYTQFGRHATDVALQGAYQHLVIDRGAVRVDQVLWSYR